MAARTFRSEDEEAQYCLSALRDGTSEEKIVARERLATIFAQRSQFEEAAELYELNVQAGVRSPELFEHLSETYRQLGDPESAEAALIEARRLRGPTPLPAVSAAPVPTDAEVRVIPFPSPSAAQHAERSPSVGAGPRVATARLPIQQSAPALSTVPDPSTPDQSRRAGRSVPGPLLVFGIVLFLIVLPVQLLALLVINPIGLYLEGRSVGPVVPVSTSELPRLKIAAGASATWHLQTGRSISGLWATPGLALTLDQELEDAGQMFTVTAPRPQAWGETITIVERRGQDRANQETIVPATFEAPVNLPSAGTVIDGRIAGEVTAPRLNESSQFTTTAVSVDLPVQLVVVSGLDLWLDRLGNAMRMFLDEDRWLLITIVAMLTWCALAGGAAILFRGRQS